jgi:hypothetical protein
VFVLYVNIIEHKKAPVRGSGQLVDRPFSRWIASENRST